MSIAFSVIALSLSLVYALLQSSFVRFWRALPNVKVPPQARAFWSVVIAARNEARHLSNDENNVLAALSPERQNFNADANEGAPEFEVIFVDDHSTDATAELAGRFSHVRVMRLPDGAAGKKAALAYGIAAARGCWIATLDADVTVGSDWLASLDAYREGHVAIAGPVELVPTVERWFDRWQALDFCGMMVITGASIARGRFTMGNGANLAFAKTAYEAVGGYAVAGAPAAASGDDMVLLAKLHAAFPGQIAFAKTHDAVVRTSVQTTLGAFVQQRWRWSAKTGLNQQPALTMTLGFVWIYHLGLLLAIPLTFVGAMPTWVTVVAWFAKLLSDAYLLREATRWFDRRGLLHAFTYPLDALAHACYIAGVGTLALLPIDYAWKGRRHRV